MCVVAGETKITIVGNVTADPDLKYTSSGIAILNFTVASTPRTFDRDSSEWKDGEPLFMPCSVFRKQAENAAESLTKGTRVIVTGCLRQRTYETKTGDKRTVTEMIVDEMATSILWNSTTPNKKSTGRTTPPDDPWMTSTPTGERPTNDEPF